MSKKKKKRPAPNRSVLDEPILKAKEPDTDASDDIHADKEDNTDALKPSESDILLSEDDSISDLPAQAANTSGRAEDKDAADDNAESGYAPDADDRAKDSNADAPDGIYDADDRFEDDFPDEVYADGPEYDKPPLVERMIEYTSAALSVFMLGASLVFWYVMLRFLLRTPYALADSAQMRILLVGCAVFPAVIAFAQHKMRRPVTAERWLICLCLSGALTTLLVVISQTMIRHMGYTISDLPLTLCCAVSGCALPAAMFIGIRLLIMRFRNYLHFENSRRWDTVRRDVLSLTDFDRH